ncbi:MAG TPA: extracellular solute-binding protein [Spirochaetales bacterium]|jgi:raffinose/stachyose/melibiose transport system substrate-binding protein|nr:extracellular solute-binding protein [Spirochaetales bacterium]
MKKIFLSLLILMTVASAFGANTKITVIHYMAEKQKQDALTAWIDGFKKKNPGVDFEVTAVQTANYTVTLKTMIASGDIPDIIFGKPKEMSDLIQAGHIADLSKAAFLKNLNKDSLPAVTISGKVYGVPIDLQTIGVFYNKDVFAKYKLSVPKTWSEFIALADTLKSKNVAPFAHPYKDNWTLFVDFYADEYVARQDAPTFYEDIESGKKTFAGSAYFKNTLTRFLKRVSYNAGDDWGTDNSTAQSMLATGKAGMYVQGNWSVGDFVNNYPNAKIGFFPMPVFEDVKKNLLPIGVDDCWMISAASKNRAVIDKFFEYATGPEATIAWMKGTKTIASSVSADKVELDPISKDIVSWIKSGKVTNFHAPVLFSSSLEDVYRNMIIEAAATVSTGKVDIDALIKKFDDKINEVR